MPVKHNIVDALKLYNKNTNRRVWFEYDYEANGYEEDLYFEEEMTSFRGVTKFELSKGFEYPRFYDANNMNWSNFYERHILSDIFCETDEEMNIRLEAKEKKRKDKIKRDIRKKEKELKKLREQE